MFDEVVSVEVVRRFCQLATHRLGVGIGEGHRALVAGRVAKRLQTLDVGIDDYMNRVEQDQECNEVVGFLDFLRPRPPRFFARRDDHAALHTAITGWLASGKRRIRLWSAGCGTGEEAYGMALTALGAVEASGVELQDVDLKILATDLSKPTLQRGKQGLFDEEQLRDIPRPLHGRYFHPTDSGTIVDENLKDLVYFRRLNLTSVPYPMTGPLDGIFCHEGLAPLVASARKRAVTAVKTVLGKEGLLCTGFGDEDVDAVDEDELPTFPAATGRPMRHGHC